MAHVLYSTVKPKELKIKQPKASCKSIINPIIHTIPYIEGACAKAPNKSQ